VLLSKDDVKAFVRVAQRQDAHSALLDGQSHAVFE
jgi:hypothetical protein